MKLDDNSGSFRIPLLLATVPRQNEIGQELVNATWNLHLCSLTGCRCSGSWTDVGGGFYITCANCNMAVIHQGKVRVLDRYRVECLAKLRAFTAREAFKQQVLSQGRTGFFCFGCGQHCERDSAQVDYCEDAPYERATFVQVIA